MMGSNMWQFMQQNQGGLGYGGGLMWLGFGLWGLASIVITVEVIVLLWLWIKKLLKEVK